MARRPRTRPIDDLFGIVARLPWWACLLLGGVSFLVLRLLATPSAAPVVTQPGELVAVAVHTVLKTAAFLGQFAVPILCVFAAVVSGVRQRRRRVLVSGFARSPAADALHGMSWRDFEGLVGEGFRRQGYQALETGGGGPDGGVDLVLQREGETFLVQCKQWRALKIGVSVVRELYGVMAARGATGGFVVTSGSFTTEAEAFASGRNVKLIDGKQLFGMMQQAKAAPMPGKAGANARLEPVRARTAPTRERPAVQRQQTTGVPEDVDRAPMPGPAVPGCPLCEHTMVLRTAKKGANAGASFWGCSRYPGCRGTRSDMEEGG